MSTTSTDPIADLMTRIRNAIAVRKNEVSLPHSKIKEAVVVLLKENNFIDAVQVDDLPVGKKLTVTINSPTQNTRITEIVRLSRPGRRHYAGAANMPLVKQGRGIVIVSTSKGVMTGKEAKIQGIGGELICKVY